MKKVLISTLCAISVTALLAGPASAACSADTERFAPSCPQALCAAVWEELCEILSCPGWLHIPAATPTAAAASTPTSAVTPAPTAAVTPAPTEETRPVSGDVQTLLQLINTDRAKNGLSALTLDSSLSAAALSHSLDMQANGFFSHTSPTYGSFQARLAASGIRTLGAGENIARYATLEKAHAALMASEGHRANILGANYTHVGLGIVYDSSQGAYTITEWFARLA